MPRKKIATPQAEIVAQTVKPRVRVNTAGYTRPVLPKPPGEFRASVYEAAGAGPRSSSWQQAGSSGPIAVLSRSLDTLRNRVLYQVRNDPMASRVVDFLEGCTVGNGLRPMLRAGLADPKNFLAAQEAFFQQCDADEVVDFDGALRIVFREVVAGGECFVRLRERDMDAPENKHLAVPLQLQILPGEMVPTDDHTLETVCGIKTNGLGRRTAYKFYNKHPGELLLNNPTVVREAVDAGLMVDVAALGEPPCRERRRLELIAALEFARLHEHFTEKKPATADERTLNAMTRALSYNWGLRRIQSWVEAVLNNTARPTPPMPGAAGADPARSVPPKDKGTDEPAPARDVCSSTADHVTLYFARLKAASLEQLEAARQALDDARQLVEAQLQARTPKTGG